MENAQNKGVNVKGEHAALVAALFAAISNAVTIAVSFPMPPRVVTRVWHHAYDLGHFLALGLAAAGLVSAWKRFGEGKKTWIAVAGLGAITVGVAGLVMPADLLNWSSRIGAGRPPWFSRGALALASIGTGLLVPIGWTIGRLLARKWLRWLGVALGGTAIALNPVHLPNDYLGVHLFITLVGGALFASALAGAALPRPLAKISKTGKKIWTPALAMASIIAAASLVVKPKPTVGLELLRSSGSVLAPHSLRSHAEGKLPPVEVAERERPFFESRLAAPPVPPSAPRPAAENPIVLVLSIDGMRADVLYSGRHDKSIPVLASLRRRSAYFVNARAPGAQTAYTLASLFTGTYFSQQYWVWRIENNNLWLHEDPTPRLPSILAERGVSTVNFASAWWLVNKFGIVSGFKEETYIPPVGNNYTTAKPLVDAAIERLGKVQNEKFFLFIHFLDAHAPYNLSPSQGSDFERYVGELGLVDLEIGRLLRILGRSALAKRLVVIITADHGEAFGEHGRRVHGSSLYEELLRVPLLIYRPDTLGRIVEEPVSLIDLGPTILDIFGEAAPGRAMGQSLAPLLRGEEVTLDRPIVAESRLMRALVLRDGMKVIVDDRNHTVELYDLGRDPGELENLADDEARLLRPLSLLRKYFAAHTIQRAGYEVPYRR